MTRVLSPDESLDGVNIRLRLVTLADCTERYVGWLRDPEVNRYLETRWSEQTIETVRGFVASMVASPNSYLLAIVESSTGEHVGNIKVGPIDDFHRYADVSYFVGERAAWGKGYGTEAVVLATAFGFGRLDLQRAQAGLYETNVGSRRVLEKAGYVFEGRHVKKLRQREGDPWEDHLWFGAHADTWKPPR